MSKKNIIYVLAQSNYFTQGDRGRVTHALGVIEGLIENGYNVTVITGADFEKFEYRFPNNFLKNIHYVKITNRFWYLKLMIQVFKTLKELKPQGLIIRFKSSKLFILSLIALFCNFYSVISIVEINSFSFNYKKTGLREVINQFLKPFELFTVKRYNYQYVISKTLKKCIWKSENSAKSECTIVIPNGAVLRNTTIRQNKRECRLVYLGSLKTYYDLENIIEFTISSLNKMEVAFHIYGGGKILQTYIDKYENYPQIVFHGQYKNDEIETFISMPNDILIVPYKAGTIAEIGSPTKLFEYMNMKCPIICSSVGQSKHIIDYGKTGFVYNNNEELADILSLLGNDSILRKRIGENAYEDLKNNHTWKNRMQELMSKTVEKTS